MRYKLRIGGTLARAPSLQLTQTRCSVSISKIRHSAKAGLAQERSKRFRARAAMRFDTYAGIEGEAPAVIPSAHRLGALAFEHCAAGKNAQQTVADLGSS